jgi:hypothetical protein
VGGGSGSGPESTTHTDTEGSDGGNGAGSDSSASVNKKTGSSRRRQLAGSQSTTLKKKQLQQEGETVEHATAAAPAPSQPQTTQQQPPVQQPQPQLYPQVRLRPSLSSSRSLLPCPLFTGTTFPPHPSLAFPLIQSTHLSILQPPRSCSCTTRSNDAFPRACQWQWCCCPGDGVLADRHVDGLVPKWLHHGSILRHAGTATAADAAVVCLLSATAAARTRARQWVQQLSTDIRRFWKLSGVLQSLMQRKRVGNQGPEIESYP